MNGVVIDLVLVDDVELGSVAACGGKLAVNQLSNFDPGSVAVIRPVAHLSVSVNRTQLVHIWWILASLMLVVPSNYSIKK